MQSRLLLDIVIRQSSSIFQLFSGEDQPLLFRRNALLILNLGLHVLDRIIGFHIQRNRLSREGLDKDLHGTTSQSKHQVQSRLLLDVVVAESSAILQLLAREDQSLLLRRDAFLVLDLGLDILNRVIGLHIQRNGLSGQGFDENLHRTSSQSQYQVQGRFLLDVVVRQSPAVLQLLSRKDQPLLLRWDSLFILNLGLHILDRVIRLHIQSDRLSGQRLDKDLHRTTSQSKDQVQRRLLMNVVIRQSTSIFQLFARENQSLLLRRDAFLVLDLSLHVLDRVIGFDIQSDGFSGQRFHEDLHGTSSQSEHQMQSRLLLDIVVAQRASILQLFSSEDQPLLLG